MPDANILLAFYEVGTTAREEVFSVFEALGSRLWVPHQVALEFSRNRKRVVIERLSRFKDARRSLKAATGEAIDFLEAAIDQVLKLRDRNRTAREWNLSSVELDRESLEKRLDGVLAAALIELDLLEKEHDTHPSRPDRADEIFDRISTMLSGKIGDAFEVADLRAIVEEAVSFRYPNQIPPGYRDAKKENAVRAAGDYILWRQLISHARTVDMSAGVVLITSDVKPDWWLDDGKGRIVGPRPELVQEMRDLAGVDLVLTSLSDFLDGASSYLAARVSSETVQQVRAAEDEASSSSDGEPDGSILELSVLGWRELEDLVRTLFLAMGYSEMEGHPNPSMGPDLVLRDENALFPTKVIVEVKRYAHSLPSSAVQQVLGMMMQEPDVSGAIIVTIGTVTNQAKALASKSSVRLIDGAELAKLLRAHLSIDAVAAYGGDSDKRFS
ncbi:restriction endonuclease [Pseudonocardia sp. DSM 110487]|uniref:PIN-like domain-containing protein n=1 Tax=Pseudonocardia sp. DSM 110487 TaxID=2865833 RepID=UPI001C69A06E|nr:PIN-like domain-containing protein [Pseudonocardia sp. DSM 110487]QYN33333.1 restriction endonuclease [Pseudonocardia sp. DSM 110487]